MASIVEDPGGRIRILAILAGKRRTVRLGEAKRRDAESFRTHVEELVTAATLSRSPRRETVQWLADLDPKMQRRLERAGLVKATRGEHVTLKHLLSEFDAHDNVKPSTKLVHGHATRNLRDFFGEGKLIREIGALDADRWRQWLIDHEKLSGPTISKRVKIARQIFARAVRWKMADENPFTGVKAGAQTNSDRQFYLSREDAQKVLDACPDAEWRLLFALSRYGGLRCPSEHLLLKWDDIDWANGKLLVTSPKTEHHDGGDCRMMPLFPELRPYLEDARELAPADAVYCVTRYRLPNANLRTRLNRIIRRAGLKPWPKLFHNLRATRQTELENEFPSHVVCAWLGNSPTVARKHYLQVTDEHFDRAAQSGAENGAASAREASQGIANSKGENAKTPGFAERCEALQTCTKLNVAPVGLEPTRFKGDGF